MKTNVNMIRKLDNLNIIQRTKDGYFDGNLLLSQWNKLSNAKRRMDKFLDSPKTQEFTEEIKSHVSKNTDGDYQVVIINKGKNTKRGKKLNEVWMHPYLFIDFAMWINPAFKYKVIQFVYDQLMENRNNDKKQIRH